MSRLWSAVCVYVVYIVGKGAFDVFGQACSGEHPLPPPPQIPPTFHLTDQA